MAWTNFVGSQLTRCSPRQALVARSCRQAVSRRLTFKVVSQAVAQSQSKSRSAAPVSFPVLGFDGSKVGEESLSLRVASSETAKAVVHRYVVYVRNCMRAGTANTKTRSEVRGGGKKPYKQKGTGNARQGSRRTPLRPGGGVIFGPKPRDWSEKMNKKERRLAIATALQSAADDIVVIEDLDGKFTERKTKLFVQKMREWGVDVFAEHTLLIMNEPNQDVILSSRNVEKVTRNLARNLRGYDVLRADRIVIEKSALKYLQDFFSGVKQEIEESVQDQAEEAVDTSEEIVAEGSQENEQVEETVETGESTEA
eukprot:TRINITY_DN1660_c0_g1_i1.p1 TRINITY_DN1660_c0_g1~~TRINITY_DN1660_c0_g1_i1.p1  ORF type:complete len:337 (+),score=37.10 TRINITY_DN1660_c0_g1_i1:80-1012(+)